MIKINCETKDTLKLADMVFFQGNLKKRTNNDIEELKKSLETEGLMMPFAVWTHEDKNLLLDGHGRKQAIMRIIEETGDNDMLAVDWPVIHITAETEDDARKALLQITSSYGKITKNGYKQFCVSIPEYRAPAIQKYVAKPVSYKAKPVTEPTQPNPNGKTIIKIKVSNDKVEEVKQVLKEFSYIEVL